MNPYPERHNWWYRSPEELGTVIQVTKDCRKATMSRTPDERLDQNPTAEVQGLGRDIGNSPSIREVSRSRSDGSSSRIRESASTLEQSPAQVAQLLLQSRQLANQQEVPPKQRDPLTLPKEYRGHIEFMQIHDDALFYRDVMNDEWMTNAIVLPATLEHAAMEAYHASGYIQPPSGGASWTRMGRRGRPLKLRGS